MLPRWVNLGEELGRLGAGKELTLDSLSKKPVVQTDRRVFEAQGTIRVKPGGT